MLATELSPLRLSPANQGGQPAAAPHAIPGQGYSHSLSLSPWGTSFQFIMTLHVREHRILWDSISIQCLGPILQPGARWEALKGAGGVGTPGLRASRRPRPLLQIAAAQAALSRSASSQRRTLLTLSRAESASFEEAPGNNSIPNATGAPTHKANTPNQPARQSPAKAGKDSYLQPVRVWVIRVSAREVRLFV